MTRYSHMQLRRGVTYWGLIIQVGIQGYFNSTGQCDWKYIARELTYQGEYDFEHPLFDSEQECNDYIKNN